MSKWFKPGDVLQVLEDYPVLHPNKNRCLKKGDRIIACLSVQNTPKMINSINNYWFVGYKLRDGGNYLVPFNILDFAPKGDMEDCLNFLQRMKRKPKHVANQKWAWGQLADQSVGLGSMPFHREEFLPHFLYRHLPPINNAGIDNDVVGGLCFRYAKNEETAYKNACEAWLLMTPAQQSFLNNIYYLQEIYR